MPSANPRCPEFPALSEPLVFHDCLVLLGRGLAVLSMTNFLKTAYRHFARFPFVVCRQEAYRKKMQMHHWLWCCRKPTIYGIEPDTTRCKHELLVYLASFPSRSRHVSLTFPPPSITGSHPPCPWLANGPLSDGGNEVPAGLLDWKSPGLGIRTPREWYGEWHSTVSPMVPNSTNLPD